MTLKFGALAPPLAEQLAGAGRFTPAELETWQRAADAIVFLAVQSLLTERETHLARRRILAGIRRAAAASARRWQAAR